MTEFLPIVSTGKVQCTVGGALGNAMIRVTVYDDQVAVDSNDGRVPQSAAGERHRQLRIQSTHDVKP